MQLVCIESFSFLNSVAAPKMKVQLTLVVLLSYIACMSPSRSGKSAYMTGSHLREYTCPLLGNIQYVGRGLNLDFGPAHCIVLGI